MLAGIAVEEWVTAKMPTRNLHVGATRRMMDVIVSGMDERPRFAEALEIAGWSSQQSIGKYRAVYRPVNSAGDFHELSLMLALLPP